MSINKYLLRKIVKGIRAGEYPYIQEKFHQGDKHCFSGWVEVLDLRELGYSDSFNEDGVWNNSGSYNSPLTQTLDTYDYAIWRLGINPSEATLLFTASFPITFVLAVADKLIDGYRFYKDVQVSQNCVIVDNIKIPTDSYEIYSYFYS